jgi:3-oxoacyl-[acyl-carrier protein] reductase
LGQALVRGFAAQQCEVGIHFRRDAVAAAALANEVNGVTLHADFDVDDVDTVSQTVVDAFPADVYVLNASAQDVTHWDDLTITSWDAMYRNSLRANVSLLMAAATQLKKSNAQNKCIVVIGSIEGIKPARSHAPYATMKAALHHVVLAAADELGKHNIRVVGIAPGLIYREGLENDWPEGLARWNKSAALGRPVTAEEVADVVINAATSTGLSGIVIPVDAGWSANPGW